MPEHRPRPSPAARISAILAGLALALAALGAAAQDYIAQKAMPFGNHDGTALTGDFYAPKTGSGHPVLIALHGGAWKIGSVEGYALWGPWLAARGYAVFAVDYRLVRGGKNLYPAAVHDVRAAIQFVRSHAAALGIDPQRIGLIGDSAGAHLAALVALTADTPLYAGAYPNDPYAGVSTRVKAVVGVYGVYDMVAQWQHDQIHRPRDNITEVFLGVPPQQNRQIFFESSPMSYTTVDRASTSFLLSWGTEDDIVDRTSQSEAFLVALKQAGFYVRPVVVQSAPHFWMWDPIEESGSFTGFLAPRLLRFLQDRL
jgi:acetyl esterase/lipase